MASEFHNQAALLQRKANEFLAEFGALLELGQKLRSALPERPRANEESSLLYSPHVALRYLQIYLFGRSNGQFSTGGLTQSVYEIVQGPDFKRRAQETVALALRRRPEAGPPEAA